MTLAAGACFAVFVALRDDVYAATSKARGNGPTFGLDVDGTRAPRERQERRADIPATSAGWIRGELPEVSTTP